MHAERKRETERRLGKYQDVASIRLNCCNVVAVAIVAVAVAVAVAVVAVVLLHQSKETVAMSAIYIHAGAVSGGPLSS